MTHSNLNPRRTIAELRDLHALTADENGAQRLCWTDTWAFGRAWLKAKLAELPVAIETDEAGNLWATLHGKQSRAVVMGSHTDSITNGGWLDGVLGVMTGLEVLRRIAGEGVPELTVRLVDWSDEEGARFASGCFGSGAAAGRLNPDAVRNLTDRDGTRAVDAMRAHGVDLDQAALAQRQLKNMAAYLELHIEQGPVLESMGLPMGVVVGTFGVERHALKFTGQAAHAGATPMNLRHDAFLAASRLAIEAREIAREACTRNAAVTTTGRVTNTPGLVTVVPGESVITLDQRCFDAAELASMLARAKHASERIAAEEGVSVHWKKTWGIEPIQFDARLVALADACVCDVCGVSYKLPSGRLHDAAEMSSAGIPVVMLFAQSLRGLSHAKEEDTREEHLDMAVRSFDQLATRALAWAADA